MNPDTGGPKRSPKKKRTSCFKELLGGLEASFGTERYRYVFDPKITVTFFVLKQKTWVRIEIQ
jgi:hypothetical protein